jgi:hypothetical protein
MKKLFFCAMMGVMTIPLMSFAGPRFAWTSTCGVKHITTFPDNWTYTQISNSIAALNQAECGVKPSVSLNLN